MFYITSTKGGACSARLCESLASVLPRGVFERRGRKPIEGVVARARKLGKSRVLVVGENSMGFISVSAASWKWLGAELRFSGVEFHPAPGEAPESVSAPGKLADVFGSGKGEIAVSLSQGSFRFLTGRKRVGPELKLVDE